MAAEGPPPDSPPLRFADWMAHALHDPQSGYYATQIRGVGRRGDFATSASASHVLGEAVARWIRSELRRCDQVAAVIEVGGGDGSLSAVVRQTLGWWWRRRLRWMMVETSAPLRAQQKERLGDGSARWFEDLSGALEACGGRALIFHNELVDAFPVDLYEWDGRGMAWREVWLARDAGAWKESLVTPEQAPAGSVAFPPESWRGVVLRDGQRLEVASAYREWQRGWAPKWRQGAMLTIDYGDLFPQVYHRQPRGTVRAYFRQQRLVGDEVYQRMGKQDITADMNFSDLIAWGGEWGWTGASCMTQRDFLLAKLPRLAEGAREDAAAAYLLDEHGAGGAFKVLVQRPAELPPRR